MPFTLGPRAAQAGYRIASFETLGSTNAEAFSRARAGEGGPLWIVAAEQTQGRGRRGRAWSTSKGNVAASLLITCAVPPGDAATLGFVAALALEEAIRLCAPGLDTALKWPNDVLAAGGKLAGILLESERTEGQLRVVVGIGVNVASAPEDVGIPAVSLAGLGRRVRPEDLFAALSDAWVDFHAIWDGGAGMAKLRNLWLARAAGIGQPVSISVGDALVQGIFETLDERGRLIVRMADNREIAVAAGDVHFGLARTVHKAEAQ
jgi:BirA family biotin operon repressor/biotin-[acetyl-CoA-carboxylase] ligase